MMKRTARLTQTGPTLRLGSLPEAANSCFIAMCFFSAHTAICAVETTRKNQAASRHERQEHEQERAATRAERSASLTGEGLREDGEGQPGEHLIRVVGASHQPATHMQHAGSREATERRAVQQATTGTQRSLEHAAARNAAFASARRAQVAQSDVRRQVAQLAQLRQINTVSTRTSWSAS